MFQRPKGYWHGPFTDVKSQREDWYQISRYIAEFWCTVSNIGFLLVAWRHQSLELLFAGIASILSHAIPKPYLLLLDKFGVFLALTKLVQTFAFDPFILMLLAALALVQALDVHLARNYAQTWPHVVWHLSAAFVADVYLTKCNVSYVM